MTPEDSSISCVSTTELLGRPLNDVEQRYDPRILYAKGRMKLPLISPRVSIVGSRKASASALSDCKMITRKLVSNGVVIVSGLAEGIDRSAHMTAIEQRGKTIGVLGTPLNKTYPQKNFSLQQEIMHNHLAISQFEVGHPITRKNFVLRNRTMALISDATIIVEASNSSGSLHQGWEALRLCRPLFIWNAILKKDDLKWPEEMIPYGAVILDNPTDVLQSLPTGSALENITLLS